MKRYKQFQPLAISDFEVVEWQHPVHQHNHYELIYILYGSGRHLINQLSVDYKGGEVFLIGPEDAHYFEVKEKSRFIYLKFTDPYIHQQEGGHPVGIRHLEYLIKSRETHLSGFQFSPEDKVTVRVLFEVIVSLKNDILANEPLIWMQVLTLSHILQRNMPEIKVTAGSTPDMQVVFCYIHKHIYYPANLRAKVLAAHFNRAQDYFGPYFKRNTGMTLREYIHRYRSQLIRQRLDSGRYSLKQIAAEFGLIDESHVSKLLKH